MSGRAPLSRIASISGVFLLFAALTAEAAITRVEQNDKNISYSGNWYSNENGGNSGGSAALTNTRGARVSITFTGSGISWVGVSDGWSGLATVYLDGSMKVVDTYGNRGYQQVLFRAAGLPAGPHTLSIEVTHERGPGTDGSWVWIDAFDIENGEPIPGGLTASAGRVEENNPSLVYLGRWYANGNPAHSGGNATLATDAGSKVTINFNGTAISWLAYRDEWSGIARVYVDGVEKSTIDNYLSPAGQRVVYSTGALPLGSHSLTIEVTGSHNQSAKGSWVWLDAFDVSQ
jgi:hypothetical protein